MAQGARKRSVDSITHNRQFVRNDIMNWLCCFASGREWVVDDAIAGKNVVGKPGVEVQGCVGAADWGRTCVWFYRSKSRDGKLGRCDFTPGKTSG